MAQPQIPERLLVQIATYNTNLQGVNGLPQDLVDWLSPTFQVSNFLSPENRAPDIIAVGFQELLPLHLGLSGLSRAVLNNREVHILSQIEKNAPNKERYTLIAKVVNGGVALLVFGRDDGVARSVHEVQTQWVGCGPYYMGNKGGVGIRFRVKQGDEVGETFTFVCAHLTAHEPRLQQRIADYHHIIECLTFPPVASTSRDWTTIYATSHLFFLGDLNFRISLPSSHPLSTQVTTPVFSDALNVESTRQELSQYDQLLIERMKGSIFVGLHEGDFYQFKPSYKYELGHVDIYSRKRTPSWTDRILYATHSDSPDTPNHSQIVNVLYTSIPSYTTSDHKPVVCVLLLPPRKPSSLMSTPLIKLPPTYLPRPDNRASLKRFLGRSLDYFIGFNWCWLTWLGFGSTVIGVFNFLVGIGAWSWLRGRYVGAIAI